MEENEIKIGDQTGNSEKGASWQNFLEENGLKKSNEWLDEWKSAIEFIKRIEDMCEEAVNNYRQNVSDLEFDSESPYKYKQKIKEFLFEFVTKVGKNLLLPFNASYKYDEQGTLLESLAEEFLNERWRPLIEESDLKGLANLIPETYFQNANTIFGSNDLASFAYGRVMQFIDEGDFSLDILISLLKNEEEFWSLKSELPEIHSELCDRIANYSEDELVNWISADHINGDGIDMYFYIFNSMTSDSKQKLLQVIEKCATDEQKEKLADFIVELNSN